MKVFNDAGYLNIKNIIETKLPFIFVVGARGTGKTYGALEYVLDNNIKFVYMRRIQKQIDLISKNDFSPFKSLCEDGKELILTQSINNYAAGFYKSNEDGKASGAAIGYALALSTISNLRGFDMSDVKLVIYDEFIPEKHERSIKNEGEAFLNAYETINRNRELEGEEPLQVICLANANDLGNPVFAALKLIAKVETMQRKKQLYSLDYNRGVGIFLIGNSPISERKKDTALYKLTSGSDYSDMAIANAFADIKHSTVKPQPLKEYKPIVSLGEITFYKHKSNNTYYCSTVKMGSPETFEASDTDIKRFLRKYSFLYLAYMKNIIYFEDTTSEVIYNHYIG